MLWLLRGLEPLKYALVFVRKHVCDISFLVGNYRIEHVFFTNFFEAKRSVASVVETCTQVECEVLFHV